MKHYYEAYEERYKTAHGKGVSWAGDIPSPIVLETVRKYGFSKDTPMLEIGCGEGRDAGAVLEGGYDLTATDLSPEAVAYCREKYPAYAEKFAVLDCIGGSCEKRYGFIYAVAVVHMLVLDGDRDAFYGFIRDHLMEGGVALVCSMGEGKFEMKTDPDEAFVLKEREHPSGKMRVAATSCRMVSFDTFKKEIARNGLTILETGLTEAMPDFNSLQYAVVGK